MPPPTPKNGDWCAHHYCKPGECREPGAPGCERRIAAAFKAQITAEKAERMRRLNAQ